jgi:hypothetical protein
MPTDTFKPRGPTKANSPDSGGGGSKQYPVIGIVKDNIDADRSGKIRVALQDGQGTTNPNDASGWTTVQYLTSFFGVVNASSGQDSDDLGTYKNNSSSYGQWQAPPDIGTKVVCLFINGDPSAGFYIGSIPEPETLQMVPAIGASDRVKLNAGEAASFGGATRLPVTNLNTNNKAKSNSNQFLDTPRPVHSYTASVMSQQGIIRDPVRGPISSSASRETSSRVGWGVSTPGRPIYEGGYNDENLPNNLSSENDQQLRVISRRGGHSIVMDDGDIIGRDQLIRIRTAMGHQILMSDDGQTLMLLHSNGQSYIELGKEGTVDIFSTNSINLRTQGDFNVHADRHINLHAMENLNIQAKNIHTNSEEETKSRAGKDYKVDTLGNFTVKAASAFAASSGGESSMVAGGQAFVNGSKVNLNSGSPGLTPAAVPIIALVAQTDTLFDQERGWAAAPGRLLSIASRTPAHFPWANAGMGVDIRTSGNASDNLPQAPSAPVQAINNAAANSGATPPNTATVASVPSTESISPAVDKNTTAAVLGAVATTAATGETAPSVTGGAAVIPTSADGKAPGIVGAINKAAGVLNTALDVVTPITKNQSSSSVKQAAVVIGAFAQTPAQLVKAGILKPGSETLINGLASSGKSILNAVPNSMFTGKSGAENVTVLAKNVVAQSESIVNVMQVAQKNLGSAGVLTGKESPTQTAGLVAAASTAGIEQTVAMVKEAANNTPKLPITSSTLTNAVTQITDPVTKAIDTANAVKLALPTNPNTNTPSNITGQLQNLSDQVSGLLDKNNSAFNAVAACNEAANLANTLGGLGGITNALKGMGNPNTPQSLTGLLDSAKGVAGSAYNAIINSFPKLEPDIPQYLTEFAKNTAAKTAAVESTVPGAPSAPTNPAQPESTAPLTTMAANGTGELQSVSSSTTPTVNNTVAGITGSLQNTDNSTTSESTTTASANSAPTVRVSTLVNNVTSLTANVADITTTTTNLINQVTGGTSDASRVMTNINNAINDVNGLAGGAQSLAGGLTTLSNAAKSVQAGGGAAKASTLASGLNNLPGGIRSVSSVVDRATGALNAVPGTGELTGMLRNAQTEVQNGIRTANTVLNTVDALTNSSGGLSAAIGARLPLGEASRLLSALSALGSGGASPIRLPELGINTLSRAELTSQINRVIGDLGIPAPNFLGEILGSTIEAFEKRAIAIREERAALQAKIDVATEEEIAAGNAFVDAFNNLPEGDPRLEELRNKFNEASTKTSNLVSELENLGRRNRNANTAAPTPDPQLQSTQEQDTSAAMTAALNNQTGVGTGSG